MMGRKHSSHLEVSYSSSLPTSHWNPIAVNSATFAPIAGPFFSGGLRVFIKNYKSPASQSTAAADQLQQPQYFASSKRLFSIQFHGEFSEVVNGDDLVFGVEFERPLEVPYFTGIAVRFVKFIDPGLSVDVSSRTPSMTSPLLCAMNAICAVAAAVTDDHNGQRWPSLSSINDNFDTAVYGFNSVPARRKFFQDARNRRDFVFRPGVQYSFEFFNPFVNWNSFDIELGMKFNVLRYLNNQPV
eukprot:Partr_v1_DN28811_c1_g1_i2_m33878 putative Protein of unknown function (DUF1769)